MQHRLFGRQSKPAISGYLVPFGQIGIAMLVPSKTDGTNIVNTNKTPLNMFNVNICFNTFDICPLYSKLICGGSSITAAPV